MIKFEPVEKAMSTVHELSSSSVRGGPSGAPPHSMMEFLTSLILSRSSVHKQSCLEFMSATAPSSPEDSISRQPEDTTQQNAKALQEDKEQ